MTEPNNATIRLDQVDTLLAALTDAEKLSLLDGADVWRTKGVPRLGVPPLLLTDGPHGLRKEVEGPDHAGVGESVPATCFPPAAGLASSWDPALAREVGAALGQEARAGQVAVVLGPGLNIKRSPLCGRNFEYFSEDPFLAGELAGAMALGVQSRGVGACLKHFVANNQETDRMRVSAQIDPRTLREIYLAAFERAWTVGAAWTVMSSYNRVNGTYVGSSRPLLTDVLRDQWGFDGLVMSDWGAVDNRAEALRAGLDLEMPSSSGAGEETIRLALREGRVTMADVDRAVHRLLTLAARVGEATAPGQTFDVEAHHALARRAATRSAVLLKNEGALLPLDPKAGGPIAVIGEFARTPRYQGAGSSQVNPTRLVCALDAIREVVGSDREVRFAPGFGVLGETSDTELMAEAVRTASDAEVVLMFLGLPGAWETEGMDRTRLDLPEAQTELLARAAEANPNVVVALSNGGVVDVAAWDHRTPAVLEGWLLGQAGGSALADLLFGVVAPSGKLAETIPLRLEDGPSFGNFPGDGRGAVEYGERTLVGYRWYQTRGLDVAYPFGHGLTYTAFEYSDAWIEVLEDGAAPSVAAHVTVKNVGERAGREVAQVYVHDRSASVERPDQELRAFTGVTLAPGESRDVTFLLDARAFAFWDVALDRWFVEGGEFEIRIGSSSADIRETAVVELSGDPVTRPLTLDSTLEDWLTDPSRGPWLVSRLDGTPFAGLATDPATRDLMGFTPMARMTRFPGFPVTIAEVEAQALI